MRGSAGERLGLAPGSSLDFHDYREYQPGDDLRRLDWSVYARSDKEIVKLFQEEVSPKLEIILDTSRSMDMPGTAKADTTRTLCAALSSAAANARCTCAVFEFDSDISIISSPTPFRRNSIRVLISDLMFDTPPENILRRLRDHAAALTVIQPLTDSETNPRPSGSVRLDDIETSETLDLTLDETACAAYRSALASHRENWNRECRRCGATFIPLNADILDLTPLVRAGILEP